MRSSWNVCTTFSLLVSSCAFGWFPPLGSCEWCRFITSFYNPDLVPSPLLYISYKIKTKLLSKIERIWTLTVHLASSLTPPRPALCAQQFQGAGISSPVMCSMNVTSVMFLLCDSFHTPSPGCLLVSLSGAKTRAPGRSSHVLSEPGLRCLWRVRSMYTYCVTLHTVHCRHASLLHKTMRSVKPRSVLFILLYLASVRTLACGMSSIKVCCT